MGAGGGFHSSRIATEESAFGMPMASAMEQSRYVPVWLLKVAGVRINRPQGNKVSKRYSFEIPARSCLRKQQRRVVL